MTEKEQWCCLQAEPQWAYEWRITNYDWAKMMCELAREKTEQFSTKFMLPDNLHRTSHVIVESDEQYEKYWFEGEKGETLSFDKMFWTKNVCAVSVCLTEKQLTFYLLTGQSVPHLSLSNTKE